MLIETERPGCVLRPWHERDQPGLVAIANNVKIWRNLTDLFPHPYTEADADAWIALARETDRSVHLAIEVEDRVAGGIGALAGSGVSIATADFGYWLGEPYWGRGLATAAARALAGVLMAQRRFARLQAPVFAGNAASMRVLEKAGFVREGVLRQSVTKDGALMDSVMYARTAT